MDIKGNQKEEDDEIDFEANLRKISYNNENTFANYKLA